MPERKTIVGTTDDEKPTREARKQSRHRKLRNAPNWIQSLCGIALVGITFFYTYYAKKQRDASLESNRISRESLESVQRAFVVCKEINQGRLEAHLGEKTTGFWEFFSPCENTGTTPAKVTAQNFDGRALPAEPTEEEFSKVRQSKAVIGPKDNRRVGHLIEPDSFISSDMNWDKPGKAMIQINRQIFFWGWISYNDVLPQTKLHVTEFCYLLTGVKIIKFPPDPVFGFGYIPCEQHNCADENCEDYQRIVKLAEK